MSGTTGITGFGTTADAATPSNKLGKDEFLKLLMAQMGAQDPLSPTDSSAMVAQLAQFANVEQLQTANARLELLLVAQAASNQTSTVALVGKDVTFKTDSVTLTADRAGPTIQGNLAKDAATVTAVITDANGKVVRTIAVPGGTAGSVSVPWDGRDDAGTKLAAGTYKVALTAKDVKGASVAIEGRSRARVTGITYEGDGVPRLLLNGLPVSLNALIRVEEAVAAPTPN
jgi:flagellar basal-body rod modification protein FlgD